MDPMILGSGYLFGKRLDAIAALICCEEQVKINGDDDDLNMTLLAAEAHQPMFFQLQRS